MLAWFQHKDKCWHDFVVKTLDATTLQKILEMAALKRQVLVQLSYQEKHAAKQKQAIKKLVKEKIP